jgi:hypothetical protein
MKLIIKSTLAALATIAATASNASATCILFICIPDGHGNTSPPPAPTPAPHGAPEIDVTQGVAAVAILICALLFLRERFMRQRA